MRRKQTDWGLVAVATIFGIPAVVVGLWLVYLFVSVIFLGESSECPQHLCL